MDVDGPSQHVLDDFLASLSPSENKQRVQEALRLEREKHAEDLRQAEVRRDAQDGDAQDGDAQDGYAQDGDAQDAPGMQEGPPRAPKPYARQSSDYPPPGSQFNHLTGPPRAHKPYARRSSDYPPPGSQVNHLTGPPRAPKPYARRSSDYPPPGSQFNNLTGPPRAPRPITLDRLDALDGNAYAQDGDEDGDGYAQDGDGYAQDGGRGRELPSLYVPEQGRRQAPNSFIPDRLYVRDRDRGIELPGLYVPEQGRRQAPDPITLDYYPEPIAQFGHYILALLGIANDAKDTPTNPYVIEAMKLPFEERVAEFGIPDLVYPRFGSPHYIPDGEEPVVNIATLQRINLHMQQRRLIVLVEAIRSNKTLAAVDGEAVRITLKNYLNTVRDYYFMKDIAARESNQDDPFIITSRTSFGRKLMSELMPDIIPSERGFYNPAKDYDRPVLPGGSRHQDIDAQDRRAFFLRLGSALLGGIALIGPMLLMLLYKTFLTSIVTVSVAVVIFGLALALFLKDSMPLDIMAAVAAYAAVLVVFVGTSSP